MTARDIKCVRCKALYTSMEKDPFKKWEIISDNHGRVCVGERHYNKDYWHWIGLCPDCQIKPEKNMISDKEHMEELERIAKRDEEFERIMHIQENNIIDVAAVVLALTERIEKLERQNERLWEVVKCLGREEK